MARNVAIATARNTAIIDTLAHIIVIMATAIGPITVMYRITGVGLTAIVTLVTAASSPCTMADAEVATAGDSLTITAVGASSPIRVMACITRGVAMGDQVTDIAGRSSLRPAIGADVGITVAGTLPGITRIMLVTISHTDIMVVVPNRSRHDIMADEISVDTDSAEVAGIEVVPVPTTTAISHGLPIMAAEHAITVLHGIPVITNLGVATDPRDLPRAIMADIIVPVTLLTDREVIRITGDIISLHTIAITGTRRGIRRKTRKMPRPMAATASPPTRRRLVQKVNRLLARQRMRSAIAQLVVLVAEDIRIANRCELRC